MAIDTLAESTGFLNPDKGNLFLLDYEGSIYWSIPLPQLKIRCQMHISHFPYDQQLCSIIFGSWVIF